MLLKLNRTFSNFHFNQLKIMGKRLAAFDFDHTIIEDNSDKEVMNLIDKNKIPDSLKVLYRKDGWTAFMQGIFRLLHENGKNSNTITKLIENLQPVNGFPNLLTKLKQNNYDIIIISDSNSYFINVWLKHHKLDDKVLHVFTNPADFVDGMLRISMYHLQDYCKLSTKNLCKGQILDDFVAEQKTKGICYGKVVYCGDGSNDFCPILRLSENDVACVRDRFRCLELVQQSRNNQSFDKNGAPHKVRAKVCVWNNGQDILDYLMSEEESEDQHVIVNSNSK